MYNVEDKAGPQGRLPAPVTLDGRPDLHGRHLLLGRPRHQRRQHAASAAARRAASTSSTAAASRARRRSSTTSSSTRSPTASGRGRPRNELPDQRPHHPARQRAELRAQDAGAQRLGPDRPVRRQRRSGKWAIAYDEFGYAKTYGATAAWIAEQAGQVGAALRREHLGRPRVGHAAPRPQPGALRRLRQRQPDWPTRSRRTATSSPSARRPADRPTCKGAYANPGVDRDALAVDALHRVRGPGEHGADRLLAAPAQPLPGARQLHRPHARHRSPNGSTPATASTPGSRARSAKAPPVRRTRWRTSPSRAVAGAAEEAAVAVATAAEAGVAATTTTTEATVVVGAAGAPTPRAAAGPPPRPRPVPVPGATAGPTRSAAAPASGATPNPPPTRATRPSRSTRPR